jgi:membrane protein implicated in regulation of membrane protease activity
MVFVPIFNSYWDKRNTINGLRQTRLTLLFLVFALIFENVYFLYYGIGSILAGVPTITPNTIVLIIDKLVNLTAYILLYYLFTHARKHNETSSEKNQQI